MRASKNTTLPETSLTNDQKFQKSDMYASLVLHIKH